MLMSDEQTAAVAALIERGEREGCLAESDIERAAEELALDAVAQEDLRGRLADRGIAIRDDCGRPAPATRYANGELARYTADGLEQFLAEAARHRLLTAAEEIELAKRDRARRSGRQGAADHAQRPVGGLRRAALPRA
jgi:RNA polymerase primary sigma factor